MVYELQMHDTVSDWKDEESRGVIVWETDERMDGPDFRICGRLICCLVSREEEFTVPDGITSIGHSAFVNGDWDCFDSPITTLNIPASVQTIEEGAFNFTDIGRINIHPDSPCGMVVNNGLYTKDGKTLLWALDTDDEGEFAVQEGTVRLGINCIEPALFASTLVLPASVTEIGVNEEGADFWDGNFTGIVIKAPKGSYAIEFAKEHGFSCEEL